MAANIISISFFGDFVCLNPHYIQIDESLKNILFNTDYNVINFEAPLQMANAVPIHKSGPNINQPTESIKWLENNNFNIISLANNHMLDFGIETAEYTKQSFSSAVTLGLGDDKSAYDIIIVEKNNIKVGILALTHHEFSCVEDYSYGCAWMGSPKVIQKIIDAKDQVDYLFIFNHGGLEYFNQPLPYYRELYKSWIDLGVDAVLASHPHVPQGWEIYNSKPIFYSLGNFLFEKIDGIYPPYWNNSLCIRMDMNKDNLRYKVLPIIYDPNLHTINIDTSSSTESDINHLNHILNTKEEYERTVQDKMKHLVKLYNGMLNSGKYSKIGFDISYLKALVKYLLRWPKDSIHHLNLYRCETHRWVMEYLLSHNLL